MTSQTNGEHAGYYDPWAAYRQQQNAAYPGQQAYQAYQQQNAWQGGTQQASPALEESVPPPPPGAEGEVAEEAPPPLPADEPPQTQAAPAAAEAQQAIPDAGPVPDAYTSAYSHQYGGYATYEQQTQEAWAQYYAQQQAQQQAWHQHHYAYVQPQQHWGQYGHGHPMMQESPPVQQPQSVPHAMATVPQQPVTNGNAAASGQGYMPQPVQAQARPKLLPAWARGGSGSGALRPQGPLAATQSARPPTGQHVAGLAKKAPGATIGFSIKPQMGGKYRASAPAGASVRPAYLKVGTLPAAAPPASPTPPAAAAPARAVAAPAAAPGSAAQAGGKSWPASLRAYVERAFHRCGSDRERAALQAQLKALISAAQAAGELWTRDWAAMPLPGVAATLLQASLAEPAVPITQPSVRSCAPASRPASPSSTSGSSPERRSRGARRSPGATPPAYARHVHARSAPGAKSRAKRARRSPSPAPTRHRTRQTGLTPSRGKKLKARRGRSPSRSPSEGNLPQDNAAQHWDGAADSELTHAERLRRATRQGRFGAGQALGGLAYVGTADQNAQATPGRKARLASLLEDAGGGGDEADFSRFVVRGTATALEKSYFRLTSAPDPSTVRPEPVLRAALARLVGLIRSGAVNYFYAQDQFKGLRQDCTVQHLRTELAVAVYEAHARAALEYGDGAEYNQCQARLGGLYTEGVSGCVAEFTAYWILHQTAHARAGSATALLATLRAVPPAVEGHPAVRHAKAVRGALAARDYATLFKLYASAPSMGRALLDVLLPRTRYDALNTVVKAYRPGTPLAFLARLLGFVARRPGCGSGGGSTDCAGAGGGEGGEEAAAQAAAGGRDASKEQSLPGCSMARYAGKFAPQEDEEVGAEACLEWAVAHGAVVNPGPGGLASEAVLDCKASTGQLFVPEDTTAVAHGDANLAIDDFLSKAIL